jgi:hypothetical protein
MWLIPVLGVTAFAQGGTLRPPRFEEYPAAEIFKGRPAPPVLDTPDELEFKIVIRQGVTKGWGVFDGTTRKEQRRPGPNFAGHYILMHFGCGDRAFTDCLMAAIVDAKTGRVHAPPSSDRGMPYFWVFSETLTHHPPFSFHRSRLQSPFQYRLDSRLLIASVCEGIVVHGGSVTLIGRRGCGLHFYVMEENGLSLIHTPVSIGCSGTNRTEPETGRVVSTWPRS